MNLNKLLTILSPVATIIVAVFGLYFWVEARYVHVTPEFKDLEKRHNGLEKRVEQKVKSDHVQQINERIWDLEDRLEKDPSDQTAKEEIRSLKEEKDITSSRHNAPNTPPHPTQF